MKKIRVVILIVLSIFLTIYLGFLFLIPNYVDLNKYSSQVSKTIQNYTGLQVVMKNVKIKTNWNLSVGALVDKIDLKYPSGEKFCQINNMQINFSLLHLFVGKIKIDSLSAQKFLANLQIDEEGKLLLQKHLGKNVSKNLPLGFKYSNHMPDIYLEKYRISLVNNANNYSLKGNKFKITEFTLDKKIKVEALGDLFLNERRQINYNLVISSDLFNTKNSKPGNILKIFRDLYKYNINSSILADLNIKEDDIDGKLNIEKLSFNFEGKKYPQSSVKLLFKGDKAKINASLHADNISKAIITGHFKTGESKYIDLKVKSDRINIEDVLLICKAMSRTLGLRNLSNIAAKGILKADFSIKSDFKKLESSGYLKITNANITNNQKKITLNSLNSDIDFSKNTIYLRNTTAKLNSQPISIVGQINKNAIADILISAQNLKIKDILLSFAQSKILNENDILKGNVNIKLILKGKLDKAIPDIKLTAEDILIKNKKNNIKIALKNILINGSTDKGYAKLNSIKILAPYSDNISIPQMTIDYKNKKLTFQNTYLYFESLRTYLSGTIEQVDSMFILNPLLIHIPDKSSFTIKDYSGSKVLLNGDIRATGNIESPKISGGINISYVNIPTIQAYLKDISIHFNEAVDINCPYIKIADSYIKTNFEVLKDFSKSIIVQNVKLVSENIDLNNIIPILKNIPQKSTTQIIIKNGKSSIQRFKVAGLVSNNIISDFFYSNNLLHISNIKGDAYLGKIAGDINYNFSRKITSIDIQGRGLSANPALTALTGRNDDINGKLDFDTAISITGYTKSELLRNLKGNTNFIVSNGKMGTLGKFEHLIYAQNVLSNNIFRATLNVAAKSISVKNTGVYRFIKGQINFSNGWANINWIKTSGPSMSLYITGRYYMPDNTASLIMLGRISDDVVKILGPIGELSMNKVVSYIPKIGEITEFLTKQFTANPNYENISQIPPLSIQTQFPTKEFKVIIDGDTQKQSSVKSFKWLSKPIISQSEITSKEPLPKTNVPDFVEKLPDLE